MNTSQSILSLIVRRLVEAVVIVGFVAACLATAAVYADHNDTEHDWACFLWEGDNVAVAVTNHEGQLYWMDVAPISAGLWEGGQDGRLMAILFDGFGDGGQLNITVWGSHNTNDTVMATGQLLHRVDSCVTYFQGETVFQDGFESGDLGGWSAVVGD